MNLVKRVHRQQRLRHVVANKLVAALTVLHELEDGRLVPPKLIECAIRDLEEVMRFVDGEMRKRAA